MESEAVPPSVNLLESMRSVGYSVEAAIADLIDNSIAAEAKNIAIDADVIDGEFLAILDDGQGMTPEVAREALRLAGSVGDRKESDLGRFGLGLKTASLSQARSLTVVSKRDEVVTALRWDIDFVRESGQWLLMILGESEVADLPLWKELISQKSGTLVVWNRLDLLLGDTGHPGAFISERLGEVRNSLALIFHRFLADKTNRLHISVNGLKLRPIDPFLTDNPKTQRSTPEQIRIGNDQVRVEAFTMPHPSGLRAEERLRQDFGDGMREAQGFYVYRNRRLISHGHWYGLARMTELSKQTRIQVDVPTSLDALWQLDIKKSRAEPPPSFKARLRQLIDPILARGHRVHTFRGRRIGTETGHIWSKLKVRDGFHYEVNLQSPLVAAVMLRLRQDDAERVVGLLKTVATTFPVLDAYAEIAGTSAPAFVQPDKNEVLAQLREIHQSRLFSEDPAEASQQLIGVEPFDKTPNLVGLIDLVWKENNAAN